MDKNSNKRQSSNRESGTKGVKENPDAAHGLRDLLEEQL